MDKAPLSVITFELKEEGKLGKAWIGGGEVKGGEKKSLCPVAKVIHDICAHALSSSSSSSSPSFFWLAICPVKKLHHHLLFHPSRRVPRLYFLLSLFLSERRTGSSDTAPLSPLLLPKPCTTGFSSLSLSLPLLRGRFLSSAPLRFWGPPGTASLFPGLEEGKKEKEKEGGRRPPPFFFPFFGVGKEGKVCFARRCRLQNRQNTRRAKVGGSPLVLLQRRKKI